MCRQNTNNKKIYVYMRASAASELRKFLHFHIQKRLFLSIFCWYIRNFVGTNDVLVGLHVPTDFQIYRQNSEKALLGGGGSCPPAPPLATLVPTARHECEVLYDRGPGLAERHCLTLWRLHLKLLNFDVCVVWWCSDGPINSQEYNSFEIYAVTINISMTEYHH